MANLSARRRNGLRLYATSPLRELNEARSNTARLRPLRASDAAGPAMAAKRTVTTLRDLVDNSPKVDELCGNGDAHLLVADEMNPGYFLTKPLYDYTDKPISTGEFVCDVHEGRVALHPDTLLIWK